VSMRAEERFRLAKIVLRELRDEPLSWTELEKRMLRQCGTHTKFRNLMRWLTKNNYIVKMGGTGSRAPYRANQEKVKYLTNGEITIKI